jgi:hypothetical protein
MNKNIVSVLTNLNFVMCHAFIKYQIQMLPQRIIFKSLFDESNHYSIVSTQMKISCNYY